MARLTVLCILARVLLKQVVATSCDYSGGYAVRVPNASCPSDAPSSCGEGQQVRCCPSGFDCSIDPEDQYCCATGTNCTTAFNNRPKCADDSWSFWGADGTLKVGGWCCQSGFGGVIVYANDATYGGFACSPVGQMLSTSEVWARSVTVISSRCSMASSTSTSTTSGPLMTATQGISDNVATATQDTSPSAVSGTQKSSSTALSGGAIAGITVGCIALVGLIFLGGCCYGRRMAKRRTDEMPPLIGSAGIIKTQHTTLELQAEGTHEAPVEPLTHELEGRRQAHELGVL